MSEIRDVQLNCLEILRHFKKFCDENDLIFYLCGGCCIGSIRHMGFIPWDDDIDVFMPRDDYIKLSYLWNKKPNNKNYLFSYPSEKFSGRIFSNISLLKKNNAIACLDIFPLDGCPRNFISREIQIFWALLYSLFLVQKIPENHGNFIKFVCKFLLDIVRNKYARYKIWSFSEKRMSKYKFYKSKYITELCAGPKYIRNKYPSIIFVGRVYKKFENLEVPLPLGYDRYLRIAFGNYMELPEKSQRIPQHIYIV
ncbi:MAG: 2-C-methyl-D-erythritol 4-phosphate cytidylyltransferase [Candidatus Paraimprobicoccus trichonymphae]|uniref:2-C-methyl-D-erythritol 4-phosphate cytidylyltransferase n=1 Tax=Candidatus Paraimprobicoccus trichonymphae TaxID=3033793 RepID=A0AA48I301_9FIRM|nr:MAG: 2-C-methyl-D-erythritol 4-phosphate cytidylyltransferase [Candidatus Paraimprobicoccus trichonymphae]